MVSTFHNDEHLRLGNCCKPESYEQRGRMPEPYHSLSVPFGLSVKAISAYSASRSLNTVSNVFTILNTWRLPAYMAVRKK